MSIKSLLPYRVHRAAQKFANLLHYLSKKGFWVIRCKRSSRPVLMFRCEYHGVTGATLARVDLANLLSTDYSIKFICPYFSDLNRFIGSNIELIDKQSENFDLLVTDGSITSQQIEKYRAKNVAVIISLHSTYGPDVSFDKYAKASAVHFVSDVQFRGKDVSKIRKAVIPNFSRKLKKNRTTRNVGIVGRFNDRFKRTKLAMEIGERSAAEAVHIWGANHNSRLTKSTYVHRWEPDKQKIYNSFDILISMSEIESFGLTVVESMSLGLPCVLSDIPAYREFAACPGVIIVKNGDIGEGVAAVDELLEKKEGLRPKIKEYWRHRFSPEVVAEQWRNLIDTVLSDLS